jgi:hypothetical protein
MDKSDKIDEKPVNDIDNNKLLSDAQVEVGIKPDVKSNDVKIQMCSLSFNVVFNCCAKQID